VDIALLQAGQPAPLFSLPDADMQSVDIVRFRGKKNLVLFFYPRDGTPACTLQMAEFSDHEHDFDRYNTVVIGISPDDCLSHAEYRDANGVSIPLLADTEGVAGRKYGVWQELKANGERRVCVTRSTFVIDKKGRVRHVFQGMNPRGHVYDVLDVLKSLV